MSEKMVPFNEDVIEGQIKELVRGRVEKTLNENCRRTKVVGAFPDGNSALMLVCARLRHVASHSVGQQKVQEYEALGGNLRECLFCQLTSLAQRLQTFLHIILDTT